MNANKPYHITFYRLLSHLLSKSNINMIFILKSFVELFLSTKDFQHVFDNNLLTLHIDISNKIIRIK